MNAKESESKEDVEAVTGALATVTASHTSLETSDSSTFNGEPCEDSSTKPIDSSKVSSKKVKIVDPGFAHEPDSDDEDSASHVVGSEPPVITSIGESSAPPTGSQSVDPQEAAADRKKTREERKKEREKKKEEEMLKKYEAEQEAKQKISAKSKCGRWIKHNLKLGKGGYKFVYRGYDTVEAKNVAWCEFKREHVDTKEKRQAMFRETEIMLKMNHPHIVRCFDVFREWIDMEDPNNPFEEKGVVIIQELMEGGTLKSAIRKNFLEGHCILKFSLITRWWHQILDALRYMHHRIQPPILHRDLKADNCFLYGAADGEFLNVKVGDFGLATHVNNSGRKTMLGTLGFMAPEIFDENYDEKVDIYAFGMLMLEVMTNRTPYDECETLMQVAAKTMSGKGPELMDKVLNPALREVIGACIHPITSYRPTAEELYFHPLFQPKALPVEVEPNYDNASDRNEVYDRFVRSLEDPQTRNPNFNLRLRFRDKKMLQELGLDDGESLEFDLDIYKAEDQDIPDLIHNLRLGYEDKLSRVFENPKQPDKKIVSSHLDKLFSSIRLQMQFMVKVLLGKRWKAILDAMIAELRNKKKQEGALSLDDSFDSEADENEAISSFTIIGKYKARWGRAKRLLDREIMTYRNESSAANAATNTVPVAQDSGVAVPSTTAVQPKGPEVNTTLIGPSGVLTRVSPIPAGPTTTPEGTEPSTTNTPAVVTTVGKFIISTPATPTVAPSATPLPHSPVEPQPVAPQNMPSEFHAKLPAHGVPASVPSASSEVIALTTNSPEFVVNQPILLSTSPVLPTPSSGAISMNSPPVTCTQLFGAQQGTVEVLPSVSNASPESNASADPDGAARPALLLQQFLQGLTSNLPSDGNAELLTKQALVQLGSSTPPTGHPSQTPQQLILAAAAAVAAAEQASHAKAPVQTVDTSTQVPLPLPVKSSSQDTMMQVQANLLDQPTVQQALTVVPAVPLPHHIPPGNLNSPLDEFPVQVEATAITDVDRKQRKKSRSKPRYLLRVTKVERDPEGSEQGTLRPTFYLEMPDPENPNSELWKLSFRCNLSDTIEDIKLFQGHTQVSPDIDLAAKEAIVQLLRALRTDVNLVKLNQDYVFYPRSVAQFGLPLTVDQRRTTTPQQFVPPSQPMISFPSVYSSLGSSSHALRPLMSQLGTTGIPQSPLVPLASVSHGVSAGGRLPDELVPFEPVASGVGAGAHAKDTSIAAIPTQMSTFHDSDQYNEAATEYSQSPLDPQSYVSATDSAYLQKPAELFPHTPYLSASSCSSDQSSQTNQTAPGIPAQLERSFPKISQFALGLQYVQDLLSSLIGKPPEYLKSLLSEYQTGLEEVAPVVSSVLNQPIVTSIPSFDSSSHYDLASCELAPISRGEIQLAHPQETNLPSSQSSAIYQSVPLVQSITSTPMVNFSCNIPASLEPLLRELVFRLCTAPHLPHVIAPTSPSTCEGSLFSPTLKLLDVRQDDILLGTNYSGQFTFKTFKAIQEPGFIHLGDPRSQSTAVNSPRLFHIPADCAVVLSGNGSVHCLNKPAIVVPKPMSEVPQSLGIPSSPISELTETSRVTQPSSSSSVHIRELPVQPNMDTLSIDDVLHLLLALRNSTQASHQSANTSPTLEAASNLTASSVEHPVSSALPLRTSTQATQIPHLPSQQQLAPNNLSRSAQPTFPLAQQFPAGYSVPVEQSVNEPPHLQRFRTPQPNVLESTSTFPGSVSANWVPEVSTYKQHPAYVYSNAVASSLPGMQQLPYAANQPATNWAFSQLNPSYQRAMQPQAVGSEQPQLNPAALQRALQVLSTLNSAMSPDQLSFVLSQIAHLPNVMQSPPSAFTPNVPHPVMPMAAPSSRPASQMQLGGTTSPPIHAPIAAIPNRVLASTGHHPVPDSGGEPPFIPIPSSRLPSSHQASLGAASAVAMTPTSTMQYKKSSQPIVADQQQQQQQQSMSTPSLPLQSHQDLINALQLLQQQQQQQQQQQDVSLSKSFWSNLPADLQHRLLSVAQSQANRAAVTSAATQLPVGFQTGPQVAKPQAAARLEHASNGVPAVIPSTDQSRLYSVDQQQFTTATSPLASTAPITIANKFTVVPVKSENEEPLAPIASSQNIQAPPRPPRQRPAVTQTIPAIAPPNLLPASDLIALSASASMQNIPQLAAPVPATVSPNLMPVRPQIDDGRVSSSQPGTAVKSRVVIANLDQRNVALPSAPGLIAIPTSVPSSSSLPSTTSHPSV